jgi:diguanylate cyclase
VRTFRWATAAFGLLAAAFFVLLRTPALDRTAVVVVDDVLCAAAPITGGALCLRRSRTRTGRLRWGWVLLGCSAILWGSGGVVWAVYELHLGVAVPFPSPADVCYLGSVPLTVAGLVLLTGPRTGWQGGLRAVLDGALVASSLLFLSWQLVLGPVVEAGSGPPLDRAVALAYPASDVLTATLALLAVSRVRGQARVVMSLLGAGLALVAVSDSAFAWFVTQGAYATGNLFDTGYVAGFLLVGAAALHPADEHAVEADETVGMLSLVLPYLPGVGVVVVLIGLELTGRPLQGVLFWLALVILVLVFVRQLLSFRVNLLLQRRLQDSLGALRERESRLEHLAHHDPLTGLPNRTLFAAVSERLLHGPSPVPCALLVIDLDDFKDVNDSHGHQAGDELLVAVAQRLAASARQSDCVARIGGDEFAMILADVGSRADTRALAERVRGVLDEPVRLAGRTVRVGASIGVAHSDDGPDVGTLLRLADLAMYQAKRDGKDRLSTAGRPELPHPR